MELILLLFSWLAAPFSYDYTVCLDSANTVRFELYYEIPKTSLKFITQDKGFIAKYRVYLQLFSKKELVAGRTWHYDHKVESYPETKTNSPPISGKVFLLVHPNKYKGELVIEDEVSSEDWRREFKVDARIEYLGGVRFNRIDRIYKEGDSLRIDLDLYKEIDSIGFTIKRGWKKIKRDVKKSSPHPQFSFAITDLQNGEYSLIIEGYKKGKKVFSKSYNFWIDNPFYLSDREYFKKVNQLLYIANSKEMRRLKDTPKENRKAVWDAFWKLRDSIPETERNETMETYFEKIDYCEQHFSGGDLGYKSDRAKAYMKYGEPDEIESHPFEPGRSAYDIWFYYRLGKRFVFEDRSGAGRYVLVSPLSF